MITIPINHEYFWCSALYLIPLHHDETFEFDRQFLTKKYVAEYFYPEYPSRKGWRMLKDLFGDNPQTYNLFHSRRSHVHISEFTYMRTSF